MLLPRPRREIKHSTASIRATRVAAPARWALTGLFPVVLMALYLVPAVALGGAVPARTLAEIHLVFLCGALVVVSAWAPPLAAWPAQHRPDGDRVLRWMLIALAVALPASRNVAAGIVDLRGSAEAFHSFMVARDAHPAAPAFGGWRRCDAAVIAKADCPRAYVFHADIRTDAGFWINRWTARYYGLVAVRALDPRPADRFR